MKKTLSLIFLIAEYFILSAQNPQLDSLKNALQSLSEDTTKVNTLLALCKSERINNELEEARKYAEKSLALAEKLNFLIGKANAYTQIGGIMLQQSDFQNAIANTQKALIINTQLKNKMGMAKCFSNIGLSFFNLSDYPHALEYHQKALKINEGLGEAKYLAAPLHNIGMVYDGMLNEKEALDYYSKSMKINLESDNKSGLCRNLEAIGNIYNSRGNYTEALKYYKDALKASDEIGDKHMSCSELFNMGVVYTAMGNYTEALKSFTPAIKLAETTGDKYSLALGYINIGNIYEMQGKLSMGKEFEMKGLSISKEIGAKEFIKLAYQRLAVIDSAMNNFKGAYQNHKLYMQYNDSVFNIEKDKKITQLQMQYDFDKKESSTKAEQEKKDALVLKELQRQKLLRNGFVGGFGVMLFFAGIFFTQRNKIKKGKKMSDDLLLNILPAEVAEELKAKGEAEAKLVDEVTVLFTDFKGFTTMSEKLTPKELVRDIHECFSAFDHIMEKYGMEKIKTIGDSYMAAGGLPTPNKTHATDAVNAAIEIRQFIEEGKARKIANSQPYFEIRIGIHTGPVVAGIVGVKKFAYDIWGDTVNTASRMESSGEVGQINVSGSTYDLVKDKFKCTHRGKIQAKGKGEIDMYFVEG